MLTSFFGNSKPINFLLSGAFLIIVFLIYEFKDYSDQTQVVDYTIRMVNFLLMLFSLLLLDFIIRKNTLCLSNNYALLLFTAFIAMTPAIFRSLQFSISGVLLMLAFRRIISLQTDKNSERKIFDASLWICLASFFYFWALIMFVPLYLSISMQKSTRFRYFLIPPIGVFTIFILATTAFVLVKDSFGWMLEWFSPFGLDFSAYNNIDILIPIAVLSALLIWSLFNRFKKLGSVAKKDKPKYLLLAYTLIPLAVMTSLSPVKSGAEFIFVLPVLAIIAANYLEGIGERYFKEGVIWLVIMVPIALLFLP